MIFSFHTATAPPALHQLSASVFWIHFNPLKTLTASRMSSPLASVCTAKKKKQKNISDQGSRKGWREERAKESRKRRLMAWWVASSALKASQRGEEEWKWANSEKTIENQISHDMSWESRRGRLRHKDSRSGGEWRREPVWQGPLDDYGSLMHS